MKKSLSLVLITKENYEFHYRLFIDRKVVNHVVSDSPLTKPVVEYFRFNPSSFIADDDNFPTVA
jgi:hypothetical protein